LHLLFDDLRHQRINAERRGTDAIDRRQMPHQHEIATAIYRCLFHRKHVRWGFHHTHSAVIARGMTADAAQLAFRQGAAKTAMPHSIHRGRQCSGQLAPAFAITFEEVQHHALRGLAADARQTLEGVDQLLNERAVMHQNGSLNPGGKLRPAAMPARDCLLFSAILATAALQAAATRSSSSSRSSVYREGSISTFCTSCLPFMLTFTSPPPASPVTMRLACSACAFCSCSC